MGSVLVVVADIVAHESFQMPFIEHNHVVKQVAAPASLCLVKTFRMLGKIRFAAIISLDSSSVLILRMTAPYHDGRKSGKDNILADEESGISGTRRGENLRRRRIAMV